MAGKIIFRLEVFQLMITFLRDPQVRIANLEPKQIQIFSLNRN